MNNFYQKIKRLVLRFYVKKIYFIWDLSIKLILSLLAAFIVLAFDEPETVYDLLRIPEFHVQWVINTVILLFLMVVIQVFDWLPDKWLPWSRWRKRLPIHLFVCCLLPCGLAYLAAYFYFDALGIAIADTSYFDNIIYLLIIFVLFTNLYQMAWRLGFIVIRQREKLKKRGPTRQKLKIKARLGIKLIVLEESEIAYFKKDGKNLAVYTFDNSMFYVEGASAIKDWEQLLDSAFFCKINQGCIVNKKSILSSIKHGARSYHLMLKQPLEGILVVSQRYYSAYSKWMAFK